MIDLHTVIMVLAWPAVVIGIMIVIRLGNVVRYVPNDQVGVVEKIFSAHGSITHGFIALEKEAGFQPDILRGGVHVFTPFAYRLHKKPLVTIAQGEIGYVFARDGQPLSPGQTLAQNRDAEDFQDVRVFLNSGGQKGPQRRVLREGTYALNLAQFIVMTSKGIFGVGLDDVDTPALDAMHRTIQERDGFSPIVIRNEQDIVGIVVVHDGPALESGEIIAPTVDGHENFQRPEVFLTAGGRRGRQLQVLVEGTYFINRLFATIEPIKKTIIEIGTVGVVVSYTGPLGEDTSGAEYKHGELVDVGRRGVWRTPMLPGKYAFNTFAGKIVAVPTTNFVLKWSKGAVGSHQLDQSLSEVSLITKDAFEPVLPLSVVLHIDYKKAPELVQRFGDVQRLVEQTLDPMVSAYFKNVGQQRTLIQLLQQRSDIQTQAGEDMRTRLGNYTLEFQEVLIGTPRAREGDQTIETILIQLRQRQIAVEQVDTYKSQQAAAEQQRELNEAQATAAAQLELTRSLIDVRVRENEGSARLAAATKDADTIRITAQATADQNRLEGEGQAAAITAIGNANATATKAQVDAYGGPQYRLAEQIATRLFEAIQAGGQSIVPHTLVNSGPGESSGALISGVLAGLLPKVDDLVQPRKNGASPG